MQYPTYIISMFYFAVNNVGKSYFSPDFLLNVSPEVSFYIFTCYHPIFNFLFFPSFRTCMQLLSSIVKLWCRFVCFDIHTYLYIVEIKKIVLFSDGIICMLMQIIIIYVIPCFVVEYG